MSARKRESLLWVQDLAAATVKVPLSPDLAIQTGENEGQVFTRLRD